MNLRPPRKYWIPLFFVSLWSGKRINSVRLKKPLQAIPLAWFFTMENLTLTQEEIRLLKAFAARLAAEEKAQQRKEEREAEGLPEYDC